MNEHKISFPWSKQGREREYTVLRHLPSHPNSPITPDAPGGFYAFFGGVTAIEERDRMQFAAGYDYAMRVAAGEVDPLDFDSAK